jgi:ubiquinone biosynthesis O-methyltransferase
MQQSQIAATAAHAPSTVAADEIERFRRMADSWWDPEGEYRALHRLNPLRACYVRDRLVEHFGLDVESERPLTGLAIIDIGCGGGLLSEALARFGASVVAIDAEADSIRIAETHAREEGLSIAYRCATAEELQREGLRFDAVVTMEVVEHVADVPAFVHAAAGLIRPGGALVVATLNRTLKSLALAKIAAEYVLRWVPRGTHDWRKFVRPSELAALMRAEGLQIADVRGFVYDVAKDDWSLGRDLDVNYVAFATAAP